MNATEPRRVSDIDHDVNHNLDHDVEMILREDELDAVTGGSFDLGSIVGSIAKAVLPMAL